MTDVDIDQIIAAEEASVAAADWTEVAARRHETQ
jgi:hypothetical protein